MSVLDAIILGLVQGLTEFFPVSSSGHLVLTESLLGLTLPGITFDVALHVATLVSVVIVYRARLLALLRGLGERETQAFIGKLVLATIPAGVIGVLFDDWFEARFDDPQFAGTMLLATGAIVWSSRWAVGRTRPLVLELAPLAVALMVSVLAGTAVPFVTVLAVMVTIMGVARATAGKPEGEPVFREPGWGTALAMGVAQAAAIIPGISRSGSTVIAGMWRRLDPVPAAEFSFLMSIPAILGAAVLKLPDMAAEGQTLGMTEVLAGAVAAGVAGVFAIRFFVGMLRRRSFHFFSYYCWIAGAAFLLLR